jgi:hypothetical protein
VAERDGAELRDAVGVADALGIEQVASFAAHEGLVHAETLVEEAFVRRDVPGIGPLLLGAPILQRRKRDRFSVEKRPAALIGVRERRSATIGGRFRRRRDQAALQQAFRQQSTLLLSRELLRARTGH